MGRKDKILTSALQEQQRILELALQHVSHAGGQELLVWNLHAQSTAAAAAAAAPAAAIAAAAGTYLIAVDTAQHTVGCCPKAKAGCPVEQ